MSKKLKDIHQFTQSDKPVSIESTARFFESAKVLHKALTNEENRKAIYWALTQYASLDSQVAKQETSAGEVFYKFLQLPIKTQEEFTTDMATTQGLERPVYVQDTGRPTTGLNQLAFVIYGKVDPDSIKPIEGRTDTLASKRVAEAIRKYKIKVGLRPAAETTIATTEQPTRALHTSFEWLWKFVENDAEGALLVKLYRKAGIKDDQLEKWAKAMHQEEVQSVA